MISKSMKKRIRIESRSNQLRMPKHHMGQGVNLTGLSGCKKPVSAVFAGSRTAAIQFMRARKAISASGDDGALNAWIDDSGKIRSSFHRHLRTLSEESHRTLGSLQRWLKEWWPRLGR